MVINIHTKLGIQKDIHFDCAAWYKYLTKGATAYFNFPIKDDFEFIKQVTFIFKQGDYIWSFEAFKYDREGNWSWNSYPEGVNFDAGVLNEGEIPSFIRIILDSQFTSIFDVTEFDSIDDNEEDFDNLIEFEVAIEYNDLTPETENDSNPVMVFPQKSIIVNDSLYARHLDNYSVINELNYVSQRRILNKKVGD